MTVSLLEEIQVRRRLPSPDKRKAIRKAADVSQERVGKELGVHRVTVARWEDGTRNPRGPLLRAYVELLDQLRQATAT